MKVKSIMKPIEELTIVKLDDTVSIALNKLEESNLLTIPVLNDGKLVGVVSKRHIYEVFFESKLNSRDEYLAQNVSTVVEKTDDISMPVVREKTTIEDVSALFISSKFRFIPVIAKDKTVLGIITQQAIFKEYKRLYGVGYNKLVIYTYDFKGTLAKIADIIAKLDGNIKNIIVSNTQILGLQEFFIRIDCKDFDSIVKTLVKKGFDVKVLDK